MATADPPSAAIRPTEGVVFSAGAAAAGAGPARRGGAVAVSIVMPVRDEIASLGEMIPLLDDLARRVPGLEVIAVDDGSRDGSFERLADARAERAWLRVVQLRRAYGKSAALATGFERARGEVVVTLDADLQDDIGAVPALVAEVREERADMAVGRRVDRKDSIAKRVPSAVFNWLVRRVGRVRFRDVNSGLKAMRREVALGCDLYGERHRLIPLIAALDGYRVIEVPVGHAPRRHGRSKYGAGRFLRGFFDLLIVSFLARWDGRPGHFFGGAGVLAGIVGAVILTYLTYIRLESGTIQRKIPLLALGILLVGVGFQLVTTAFLSELMVTRSRPPRDRYAVRRVLEGPTEAKRSEP